MTMQALADGARRANSFRRRCCAVGRRGSAGMMNAAPLGAKLAGVTGDHGLGARRVRAVLRDLS
jgi:hypothetical protein